MSSVAVNNQKQVHRRPPGPFGHWFWGTVREFQQSSLDTMVNLTREYGDAVRFRFFLHFYGYLFCHPEHNKHILQDNNRNYTKMPHPSFMLLRPVLGNGLLTSDGEFWRQQRRLAQPAFHRRRIAEFGTIMTDVTQVMLEKWQAPAESGRPFDVAEEMMRLTLEIVGRALFSIDITREAERVGTAFTAVNTKLAELSVKPFSPYLIKIPWLPDSRYLNRNIAVLNEVVDSVISQRRGQRDGAEDDLLGLLMAARDEETGLGMDDQQLRDEVMTIMLAGHETTAVALSWTFYLLSQHPDVRQKLEAELAEVLGGRVPTVADMPDLTYTTMVIEESMRLYPPAYAISRWCNEADEVGGYIVPANSALTLSPYLTHRHPDFWEEPDKFDPQRFTPVRQAERPRYAYLPFGGGPRQCIGNNFAMTEATLLLATIAQRYRLELLPGQRVEMEPLITLRPRGGLPMMLSRV
ncbi:MAG TPA: cytochrome P450 [Anaerolineae bacterium]